jgi:hypothetical protein
MRLRLAKRCASPAHGAPGKAPTRPAWDDVPPLEAKSRKLLWRRLDDSRPRLLLVNQVWIKHLKLLMAILAT